MTFPLISVVVPTYNQARYLQACLDSLFFQSYPQLEIIVVADRGSDDTFALLDTYARALKHETVTWITGCDVQSLTPQRSTTPRYPRQGRSFLIVPNDIPRGSTVAYNVGMRLATGAYCTYVASDDYCYPQMLETLAAPLQKDEADFTYADMFIVNDAGHILRHFRLPPYSFAASFTDWYLCGVAKLYRRELHHRFGYFDPSFTADDHECYLRFAKGGARFRHIPQVLYAVRSHDQRTVDVHCPQRMQRLLRESCCLVRDARNFLRHSPSQLTIGSCE